MRSPIRPRHLLAFAPGLLVVACGTTSVSFGESGEDPDGGHPAAAVNDGGVHPHEDGSGSPGGKGTDGGSDGGPAQAAALAAGMPRIALLTATGAVLAAPKLVAITYDNDPNRADVETFLPELGKSTAWSTETEEYGVGALSIGAPIHLPGPAPTVMKDADVHTILKNRNAADPETIYMMFVPAGSTIDDGSGSKCCQDYDGYHSDFVLSGTSVAYAVVCACPGFDGSKVTALQQLTICASHEAVETATDPHSTGAGYAQPDQDHMAWAVVTGGETADMCAFADTAYWLPKDMKYTVQRSWSNAAVAAGHDPCVGEPSTPYYNSIPDLPNSVALKNYGTTKSLEIAKGATGTLKLQVHADQPGTGPFTVTVTDFSGKSYLTAKNPSGTFNSGDEVAVPITVNGADPSLGTAEVFVVTTTPANRPGPSTYFYGLVSQ